MNSTLFKFGKGAPGRCPECEARVHAVRVPGEIGDLENYSGVASVRPCGHLAGSDELEDVQGDRRARKA